MSSSTDLPSQPRSSRVLVVLGVVGVLVLVGVVLSIIAGRSGSHADPSNAAPSPTVPPTEASPSLKIPPPRDGRIYHAAYPDFGGWEDEVTADKVSEFEDLVGKKLAWAMFSNNWWLPEPGITFPSQRVAALADAGVVPYIRMMPRNMNEELPDPNYSMQAFIDGDFDAELRAWARAAKAADIPLIIEFGTEVNRSWFPWNATWNGGQSIDQYGDPKAPDGAERFRDAYRGIIDLFRAEGVNNVTWVFHVDATNSSEDSWNDIDDYYPGDDYIDWIGVSVYGPQEPGAGWWSFEEVLANSWDKIISLSSSGKPIAIIEWGVIDRPDIGDKAQWISDALSLFGPDGDYPEIVAISYWHENFGKSNLRLDSSAEALEAYRRGIDDEMFVSGAG